MRIVTERIRLEKIGWRFNTNGVSDIGSPEAGLTSGRYHEMCVKMLLRALPIALETQWREEPEESSAHSRLPFYVLRRDLPPAS